MNVSAVIPVFNSVSTLERAVNSLLIQPEINEIFIVDDGSTDGSYELGLELKSKFPIIKVLTHPNYVNCGAPSSRNLGLKFCSNEWIQFLDADDELLKGKIEFQLTFIIENCPFIVGESLFQKMGKTSKVYYLNDLWNGLLISKLGNTCSNLWNKYFIDKVGGWDENLINTQEYDLMFRLAQQSTNIAFSKGFYTIIHKTIGSISFSELNISLKRDNLLLLRIKIRDYLQKVNEFTFQNNYYYSGYVGTVLRYHRPEFKIQYSKFYFLIYKLIKSLNDRIVKL